jgi:hypothetical protein
MVDERQCFTVIHDANVFLAHNAVDSLSFLAAACIRVLCLFTQLAFLKANPGTSV